MPDQPASSPVMKSAIVGIVLQVIMVVVGHYVPQVASLFPVAGTGIGGIAGLLNGLWSANSSQQAAAGGGAVAGGAGGLLGTILSNVLGDVPASTIAIGTGSTAVAGVIGGLIGKFLGARSAT
jgi:hypothetical protein